MKTTKEQRQAWTRSEGTTMSESDVMDVLDDADACEAAIAQAEQLRRERDEALARVAVLEAALRRANNVLDSFSPRHFGCINKDCVACESEGTRVQAEAALAGSNE